MPGLRLLALGVGDAFSALYYSTCLALEAEGVWLLIDCPHPIRKVLREGSQTAGLSLDLDAIHSVVLTHLHADHCSGLEGFGFFSYFALHRPASLVAHPEVLARVWDGHLAGGMEWFMENANVPLAQRTLNDFFQVQPLDETTAVQVGPFRIECRKTLHSIPTTALRIEAAGRRFGYSCDTAYDPGLIDWLAPADRIVHETNLGIHTPYEKLAALPSALRSKMWLAHYPDHFELTGRAIEPLRQGCLYDI